MGRGQHATQRRGAGRARLANEQAPAHTRGSLESGTLRARHRQAREVWAAGLLQRKGQYAVQSLGKALVVGRARAATMC
ncbi:MAG: hypothetical protein AN484_25660 [Aphanizomenon flos-aquae WA102]|uniref:Uncharacterized protein n=1 Tax=Aphanizomenon flos-aquae WA102 TaxID=1710896 RepID=A0A1B7WH81_APHFL|nr:MAG: hypothetical protein AN484_25660 [Aphanizomenon flos-aquae WA102]